MALAFAIIGLVVGITLGPRFKVLVLVPAIGFAEIFALILGLAQVERLGSILLAMVTVWLTIQLGYFVGIFLAKRIL